MSENISLSSSSESIKTSLDPEILKILDKGMKESFRHHLLDLSVLPGSESFQVNDSGISELCDWIEKLGDKVKSIDLSRNGLGSKGATILFDRLRDSNSIISSLDLSTNEIDDECIKSLCEYLQKNKNIEKISLQSNQITDRGVKILADNFGEITTFKELYLNYNEGITNRSSAALLKIIETSHIYVLGLSNTYITQINFVIAPLAHNTMKYGSNSLKIVELKAEDNEMIKICDHMKNFGVSKLQNVNLSMNKISSKGASLFFDTLKVCNSIVKSLEFFQNQLGDDCMKSLGEYIQDDGHLEKLYLSYNKISDKGIEIFSEHLIGNVTLNTLSFGGNKDITDASAPILINAIKKSHISEIVVSFTSMSIQKIKQVEESTNIPFDQREIPLKSNTKSAAKSSA